MRPVEDAASVALCTAAFARAASLPDDQDFRERFDDVFSEQLQPAIPHEQASSQVQTGLQLQLQF